MSSTAGLSPIRVERALRLLPDNDTLAPLRAFLVSISHGSRPAAEKDRTFGKRLIKVADLREFIPRAVGRLADHLTALYGSAIDALESEERGDLAGSVEALVNAGEREARAGRTAQAWVWYDHALRIAEGLRDRRPEIRTLRHLGELDASRGALETAARFYQRSFTLAEAEQDSRGAALACQGLGRVAARQGRWPGAVSWYSRALSHVQDDGTLGAELRLSIAEAEWQRGERLAAERFLQEAEADYDRLRECTGLARVEYLGGRLHASAERPAQALACFKTALAHVAVKASAPELEMDIRRQIAELHVAAGRLPAAEDEIRRAEELAISTGSTAALAELYLLLGRLRGLQGDEGGFVFFEKASELCRGREPMPRLEAGVYLEYARFRRRFGELDDCRAYLGRARELLEVEDDAVVQTAIEAELAGIGPG
ncbi:MAG: hypothetical protein ACRENB_08260 [Gemmatimonadales bacterium]